MPALSILVSDLTELVENLVEWTEPKQLRNGKTTQMCETPGQEFWELWRERKDELRELGIRVYPNEDDSFSLSWVRQDLDDVIPERVISEVQIRRFIKASQALKIRWPSLRPFQHDALETLLKAWETMFTLDASHAGIGKTWIALALMKEIGWNFGIVCPANVVTKWTDTAISEPFELEPEFVLSYDKLRTGSWDFVSRFEKTFPKRRKRVWFEWNTCDKVAVIFDEIHKCAGDKSLNAALLKAAIDDPNIYVHGASATSADSPLDMKTTGYGLRLHNYKDFWSWCLKTGCRPGVFGGMTFSTGVNSNLTKNQIAARNALTKVHDHIFPRRGVRITMQDCELWLPKNHIMAEFIDVDFKNSKIKAALKIVDEKEDQDYEKADEKEVEISSLTLNTRDRQRAELSLLPAIFEKTQSLRSEGNSVIIFLNYRASIELFKSWLEEDHSTIVGGLDPKLRDLQRDQFLQNKTRVCVCQTEAGSESIDLDDQDGRFPRCSLIVPGYKAKHLYQAFGRPYRPASTKSHVRQWVFFAIGTVMERVGRLVQSKLNGQALINDGDLSGAIDITPRA